MLATGMQRMECRALPRPVQTLLSGQARSQFVHSLTTKIRQRHLHVLKRWLSNQLAPMCRLHPQAHGLLASTPGPGEPSLHPPAPTAPCLLSHTPVCVSYLQPLSTPSCHFASSCCPLTHLFCQLAQLLLGTCVCGGQRGVSQQQVRHHAPITSSWCSGLDSAGWPMRLLERQRLKILSADKTTCRRSMRSGCVQEIMSTDEDSWGPTTALRCQERAWRLRSRCCTSITT